MVAQYSQPRDFKVFAEKSHVMEVSMKGDCAIAKSRQADKLGNRQFWSAMANFNGTMGRNVKMTIVAAENVVDVGEIDPAAVHLPGNYVKRVIQRTAKKNIEEHVFAKEQRADMSV